MPIAFLPSSAKRTPLAALSVKSGVRVHRPLTLYWPYQTVERARFFFAPGVLFDTRRPPFSTKRTIQVFPRLATAAASLWLHRERSWLHTRLHKNTSQLA